VQFDEKWDFVYKKEKHCDENDPADAHCGDNWDHVALDAETKPVLEVGNGKRTEKNTEQLVQKTAARLQNRVPRLITSDAHSPYRKAILKAWGKKKVPRRTGKRGRPKKARYRPPKDLVYATVCKQRLKGRVNKIEIRTVFGTAEQVAQALKLSKCSRRVNTSLTTYSFPPLLSISFKLLSTKELHTIPAAEMCPPKILTGGTCVHCFS